MVPIVQCTLYSRFKFPVSNWGRMSHGDLWRMSGPTGGHSLLLSVWDFLQGHWVLSPLWDCRESEEGAWPRWSAGVIHPNEREPESRLTLIRKQQPLHDFVNTFCSAVLLFRVVLWCSNSKSCRFHSQHFQGSFYSFRWDWCCVVFWWSSETWQVNITSEFSINHKLQPQQSNVLSGIRPFLRSPLVNNNDVLSPQQVNSPVVAIKINECSFNIWFLVIKVSSGCHLEQTMFRRCLLQL